jgi:hypothetical protein
MGVGPELTKLVTKLGPGEAAAAHFRSARMEFLKGVRAMVDREIESLAKKEPKGARVSVE